MVEPAVALYQSSVHALRGRLRHLEADIERWSERTGPGGDLGLHRSQLTRLRTQVLAMISDAVGEGPLKADSEVGDDGSLDRVPELRRLVNTVHLIWDFYRDKLVQRDAETMVAHLRVADDLAWACYQPFLEAAAAAPNRSIRPAELKEPPLTFYGYRQTPFAQARSKMLQPLGLDARDSRRFSQALERLPVPVIGLPMALSNRVPELVLVGHETGHVVAEDLGLAAELKTVVDQLDLVDDDGGARREAWRAWIGEVFADVFGVVATGRSFVAGLSAELVDGPGDVQLAHINPNELGFYPTPMLRMALCQRVLERLGIEAVSGWDDVYGILVGDSRDYRSDVQPLADALFDRAWESLGNKTLTAVLPWSPGHEDSVKNVAEAHLGGFEAGGVFDVRIWVAGAMAAEHQEPGAYRRQKLDENFITFINKRRKDTVRSLEPGIRASMMRVDDVDVDVDEVEVEEAVADGDRKAGRALAALFDFD